MFASGILFKPSLADTPTTDVPLFELPSRQVTEFEGDVNVTMTLRSEIGQKFM
jgi:hypothetical protein